MTDSIEVRRQGWQFTIVDNRVLLDESLSTVQKMVYVAISHFADRSGGRSYPSYATIAKIAGCSRRAAIAAIEALVNRGYITKQCRRNSNGQTSNIYSVVHRNEATDSAAGESGAPELEPINKNPLNESIGARAAPTRAPRRVPDLVLGECKNVRLTAAELERLEREHTRELVAEAIDYLSMWKEEKGRKVRNDNLALRRWAIDVASPIASVVFRHNTQNDVEEFLGYEIYYRFYIDIEQDALFQQHRESVAGANSLRPDTLLSSLGYRRLGRMDSGQPPLIRIGTAVRATDIPIEVVFFPTGEDSNGVPGDDAYARWPVNTAQTVFDVIRLRRTVDASTDLEKFFPIDDSNYNREQHKDVTTAIEEAIAANQALSIGLFVFALGVNQQAVPIYSEAVPLLYAALTDLD